MQRARRLKFSRGARGRSNRETRHAARNAHYCSLACSAADRAVDTGAGARRQSTEFAPEPTKPKAERAPPSEIQTLLNLLVDPKEQAWLQQLLNALADPKVQAWLQQQNKTEAVAPAPAAESTEEMMSTRVEAVRERIAEMVGAIPGMPAEFDNAGEEHKESGIILDLTRCGPARE